MDDRFKFMMLWLPHKWVPFEAIDMLFGVKRNDEQLWGHFRAWSARLRRPRQILRPDRVNRHAFESYLQHAQILPLKQAGARLGMVEVSFVDLLEALEAKGLLATNTQNFSPQVVSESLVRGFHEIFPDLQHRIFGDHNDYCSRLHKAIHDDLALDVDVKPVYCETSVALEQDPPDFAYEFDCLTDHPIGLRYQVWLDFKKPINLRPDACSLKQYAKHEDELRDYVMTGGVPEIPNALRSA